MKKFVQWFIVSLLLTIILTGGIVYRWTENQIFSQSQSDAKLETPTQSNTLVNPSDTNSPLRKWGYMNHKGQLVIPPRFDYARSFSSGVARIPAYDKDGKANNIGFINREGEVVFTVCGEDCLVSDYKHQNFSEGLLPLREEPNGKFGFVDTTGKFVIKPQFDSVSSFREGFATVSWLDADGKNRYGSIDRTGKIIIDMENFWVGNFRQGVAIVVEPPDMFRYGLIDRQGNLLVKPILSAISEGHGGDPYIEFSCGQMPVKVVETDIEIPYSIPPEWRGKWGYIDRRGNWVIKPQFGIAGKCTQGRAVIANKKEGNPKWGLEGTLIDERGNIIDTSRQNPKPLLRNWRTEFHEGLAGVEAENGKWGYLDRSGKWALEPQFVHAGHFSNELAIVKTFDYKYGYINRNGKFVIPPQFDFAYDFQDNSLANVKVGEKYGLINRQGQYVIEPKYIAISDFVDGIATIDNEKGDPRYYLNSDLEILPCPQWHGGNSSEGLIPIFTDVAPQKECPIARDNE